MSKKCLDVSAHQGKINFKKVYNAGYENIILKCGGSDGGYYKDSKFDYNYLTARKRGFNIGAYYFAGKNFTSKQNGRFCGEECLKIIKYYTFDFPIYIDVECTTADSYYGTTEAILAFCDVLEKAGYRTGIYASASMFNTLFSYDSVKNKSLWVADWAKNRSNFPPKCDIWQYTSKGNVNSIDTGVDLDECYIQPSTKVDVTKKNTKTHVNNVYEIYKIKYKNIAEDVINGKYGNGNTRIYKLAEKGYDYNFVQALVNAMLSEKNPK